MKSKRLRYQHLVGLIVIILLAPKIAISAQETGFPPIQSIAWSPNGNLIAVGPRSYSADEHDYSIRILNATNGDIITRLQFHSGDVYSVDWNPDGSKLVSSGHGDAIGVVWDIENGNRISISQPYSMQGRLIDVWSPDGNRIANVSGGNPSINIWNPVNGQTLFSFRANNIGFPLSIAWSPDGKKLVTGNSSGDVIIWDADSGSQLLVLSGHTDDVNSVAWSPDGSRIVSGSADSTLRIWDVTIGTSLYVLLGHTDIIWKVDWSPAEDSIASAGNDGTLRVWDALTGNQVDLFTSTEPIYAVDWSPDGNKLAYGGNNDSTAHIVTPSTTVLIPTPQLSSFRSHSP
jgi:WD40 repeat protein